MSYQYVLEIKLDLIQTTVLANSAALERNEVSGVSESSLDLERHPGNRKYTDIYRRTRHLLSHAVVSLCDSMSRFPLTLSHPAVLFSI